MAREMRTNGLEGGPRVRPVVLVVDDDPGVRASFQLVLDQDYEVVEAAAGRQALELLAGRQVDLVLLDIRLPEMDGIEVLERIKALDEGIEVILVTAVRTVRTAVAAMKLGAFDYLTKPFEDEELLTLVRRALDKRSLEREVTFLRSELERNRGFDDLVGQHPEMQKLYRLVAQVALSSTTVLITGESGTGKELIARAIHQQGPRRDRPFVPVNPAALSDTLIESELFGHEKGAFTGAYQRKLGRFELAESGTLFLDEIGSLKPDLQVKLLRVLQEREFERVGGTRPIRVDARIIVATNIDLRQAVATGAFRGDLYYRLNVMPIAVPPLRERQEDIPLLAEHFMRRYSRQLNRRVQGLTPAAHAALRAYAWPGNVRELQNVMERVVGLVEAPVIDVDDLPLDLLLPGPRPPAADVADVSLNQATEDFERQTALRALERAGWNISQAARLLGIHRNSLKGKIARWGVRRPTQLD